MRGPPVLQSEYHLYGKQEVGLEKSSNRIISDQVKLFSFSISSTTHFVGRPTPPATPKLHAVFPREIGRKQQFTQTLGGAVGKCFMDDVEGGNGKFSLFSSIFSLISSWFHLKMSGVFHFLRWQVQLYTVFINGRLAIFCSFKF